MRSRLTKSAFRNRKVLTYLRLQKEKRMRIGVLRETQAGEARVALVPESARKLAALKVSVSIESGAGAQAGARDADYEAAGAQIEEDRASILSSVDVLTVVNRPAI